jgi:mono/diheme cytochrome c family protein
MKTNVAPLHVSAVLALAGACLIAFGASVAFAQEGKSRHDEPVDVVLARVPEKARAKRNPFESDPEAATAGKKLFEQHCAECHGQAADGGKRGPSLRVGQLQQATSGEIFWILTNGVVRRGMPAWSKLPEPQRWEIIAFLREFDSSPGRTGTNHAVHNAKTLHRTGKVQNLEGWPVTVPQNGAQRRPAARRSSASAIFASYSPTDSLADASARVACAVLNSTKLPRRSR